MRDADPAFNPHRALWAEVLHRIIEDALIGAQGAHSKANKLQLTREARAYVTTHSHDLATVCALAGADVGAVIDRMKAKIAAAPTPQELVAAPRPRRDAKPKAPAQRRVATITHNGETLTLTQWAERTGLTVGSIRGRIEAGWSAEDALTLSAREAKHRQWSRPRKINRTWNRGTPARVLTLDGTADTIKGWSARTGIKVDRIKSRLAKGWPIERVLDPADQRRAAP